ncbi:hypothetical protein K504DRAFT_456562 [Pleomassaria siparia CBS 279.74]|uniref:Secreted protein n=1 Tax=Pleomassaria siparia CBS 279.74 TaxID=1314801 RepID=A0A6G1KP58_9PLEO|nr:hypothetical protein K504DRAFT_456562 [Pleomassaria siparia CBS 279.74]
MDWFGVASARSCSICSAALLMASLIRAATLSCPPPPWLRHWNRFGIVRSRIKVTESGDHTHMCHDAFGGSCARSRQPSYWVQPHQSPSGWV